MKPALPPDCSEPDTQERLRDSLPLHRWQDREVHCRPNVDARYITSNSYESDDMKPAILSAAVLLFTLADTASAHHSFAMFDQQKETTLTGTLKELQWTNPHIWVQVIVKDPATGKDVEWSIEGGSPNNLARKGWSRNTMKSGDKVSIVIHPLKNGDNGGSLVKVTVNGQTLT